MRLKIQFGLVEPEREVEWWQRVEDFPHLVIFKGVKWEFIAILDDPMKKADHICVFSQVKSYDPAWNATTYEDIDRMFNTGYGDRCECGSIYTSAPMIHMFYCPKWRKP